MALRSDGSSSTSKLIKTRHPPYLSKEDAERKTGKFKVNEMEISLRLYSIIHDYINREGLYTWQLRHGGAKTSATHTCKFTLKYYRGDNKDRAYIENGGARGIYSYSLKTRRYVNNPGTAMESRSTVKPTQESLDKFEEVENRTPDINQIYFWIAKKYSDDLFWVSYWQ